MDSRNLYFEAFSSVAQPVVVMKNDYIEYMNPAAVTLAKRELTGKHASLLFPAHILNTQAESFVTTAFIGSRSCSVGVCSDGKCRICVLTPKGEPAPDSSMVYAKLRSALSNIRFVSSCISIVGENNNDERLLNYVSSLNRSYNSIKRSIDNVSTLTMMEAGTLPFTPETFDISDACADILEAVRFMLRRDDIEINLHAQENIRVIADRVLFEQLLMNLLSNSIISCTDGGRISVSLLRTDRYIILGVNDTGRGIEPDVLSGIFEHYRRHVKLSDAGEGAGMGLAIVRGIAEMHEGTVIIESRGRDMGTSVRVMLSTELKPSTRFSEHGNDNTRDISQAVLTEFADILSDSCYSNLLDD